MRDFPDGRYAHIEGQLERLLPAVHPHFDSDIGWLIREYMDVGEYGLAFEAICETLTQKGIPISAKYFEAIDDLGRRMSVPEEILNQLSTLVSDTGLTAVDEN
jgi:Cu2+-containing amine oxidase